MKRVLAAVLAFAMVLTGMYFVKPEAEVKAEVVTADTSWYGDGSASEFVLTTRAQFYGFAELAKTNNFAGKTVKLGNSITLNDNIDVDAWATTAAANSWTPIGTESSAFAGTFDGQGYTISGLYMVSGQPNAGLFGVAASTATFKNFKLIDSYISTGSRDNAGLVGSGTFTLMENIYTNAIVKASGSAGGFIGAMSSNSDGSSFKNCWFDGVVVTPNTNAGGFVGKTTEAAALYFYNCLSTGSVTASYRVGGFYGWKNNYAENHFYNCLSVAKLTTTDSNDANAVQWGTFYGNHNTSRWNTKLYNSYGNDKIIGYYDGSAREFENDTYIKTDKYLASATISALFPLLDGETESPWMAVAGSTPILKGFKPTPDISWYDEGKNEFVLTTSGQLYGLAELAKTNTFAGKTIKLGKDIALNDNIDVDAWATTAAANSWTPIGTESSAFAGTFDGQGYTISGLYMVSGQPNAGLFGVAASTATFKNFKLIDSYISTGSRDNAGLVGSGTFTLMENIYTNAIVKASGSAGGFIGAMSSNSDGSSFKNCWFDGVVVTPNTNAGGFVGKTTEAAALYFYNCLSTGSVTASYRVGGFYGWKNNYAENHFYNCLSVAKLTTTDSNDTNAVQWGTFYGNHNTSRWNTKLYNSYGNDKIIGYYSTATHEFENDTYIKTDKYLASTAISALFPLLDGETESPWMAVAGSTPVLAGLKPAAPVPADMLNVKLQAIGGTGNTMRLITSVDGLDYAEVGFIVSNGTQTTTMSTTTVFEKIKSSVDGESYNFSPKLVGSTSKYFATVKFDVLYPNNTYTVQAYVITSSGEEIRGNEIRSFTYADGEAENYVNITVNGVLTEGVTAKYGPNATAEDFTADNVEILGVNGGYTSVRVDLAGNATVKDLKSATKFVFSDGSTAVYRNYYTSHKPATGTTPVADTSWYDVNPEATSFVIATSADLYGFAAIQNAATDAASNTYTKLPMVTLVADVVVNKGAATEEGWLPADGEQVYAWVPIGSGDGDLYYGRFGGIFDGDGNTISGLVTDTPTGKYVGLFGATYDSENSNATIKNLKLVNSYFEGVNDVGSIIGRSYRTDLENIYSNAVVVTNNGYAGGMVGYLAIGLATVPEFDRVGISCTNCWFDGIVTGPGTEGYVGGLIGRSLTFCDITFTNCMFTGTIDVEAKYVGGLLGEINNRSEIILTDCVVTGTIIVPEASLAYCGSLVGISHTSKGIFRVGAGCYTTIPETTMELLSSKGSDMTANGLPPVTPDGYFTTSDVLAKTSLTDLFEGSENWAKATVNGTTLPIPAYFEAWRNAQ